MARIRLVSILRYIYEGKTRADPLTNLRCQDIFIGFNSQILTPLTENMESTEDLFEGDMKLSPMSSMDKPGEDPSQLENGLVVCCRT